MRIYVTHSQSYTFTLEHSYGAEISGINIGDPVAISGKALLSHACHTGEEGVILFCLLFNAPAI